MRNISKRSRDGRLISKTPSGSPIGSQHGLLKASFIPSSPQRELRDFTRYRVRLTEEKAREINRVQKTLEDTNLKLGDVVSDIMGKPSRMILHPLADLHTHPARFPPLPVSRAHHPQQ